MRRTFALFAVAAVVAALTLPDAASPTPAQDFAAAGWATTDPDTGAHRFWSIISSEVDGERANFEVSGYDTIPVTCANGKKGERWVERGGSGEGSLDVDADLKGARFRGRADVWSQSWKFCGNDVTGPRMTVREDVPLAFDVTGVGRRWRDTERHVRRIPSVHNASWGSMAFDRIATGTLSVGRKTWPTSFGNVGRVQSWSHWSGDEEAVTFIGVGPVGLEPGVTSRTLHGSLLRAEGVWERFTDDSYSGLYVGAAEEGDGVHVWVDRLRVKPVSCRGEVRTVEWLRQGDMEGRLDVGGGFGTATVRARGDVVTVKRDGCKERTTFGVQRDVAVTLTLEAEGPRSVISDSSGRLEPSVMNGRGEVTWAGRDAGGTLRLGRMERTTVWAQIGRLSWSYHG